MKSESDHNHSIHEHGFMRDHHHSPSGRGRLLAAILFNALITVTEFIGGLLSGSLALVSDAWHNLSDVLALMLGYAGEKVSDMEGGIRYTFGMKRFEVLIALVNALTLLGIGVFILYEAAERFLAPVDIDVGVMLPVALVGFAGNAFSILLLMRNRHDNLNLKASFIHLLYDTVSSAAVIAGALIMRYTGFVLIDLLISIGIVIMMVWSSLRIIIESMKIFLQGAPDSVDIQAVRSAILECRGVGSLHGLHIWSVSSTEIFLSCHICSADYHGEKVDGDDIIRAVNAMLRDTFRISHTTIQIENRNICAAGDDQCCRTCRL